MRDKYDNPLITRYASEDMAYLFSDDHKFKTWRKLWIALAEAEMELGLDIRPEQIEEMRKYACDINYKVADEREKQVRHDVMAHIHAFGQQARSAAGIIHLGATSCFVGDNADLIIMDKAIDIVIRRLVNVMDKLASFCMKYRNLPTLGFTHFQPAQLTTVGKRASLWLQELEMDYHELRHLKDIFKLRGVKGTTGTQDSFLALFDGDAEKVNELEKKVASKMGYRQSYRVTGQTYPRKFDSMVLNALSLVAQSAAKFANDLRLLQSMKELEEPFEAHQIGSSAMAYKRNPMRSERIAALARYVISLQSSPANTASVQWLERTLDDSANKRLVIPQAFLAVDSILNIYANIAEKIVVYENMIKKHIAMELPFMATERILMEAVKKGGDRQEMHERIRMHSMQAAERVKMEGMDNDLLDRIKNDDNFQLTPEEIDRLVSAENFIGFSAYQVESYIQSDIQKILSENSDILGDKGEVRV